MTDKYLFDAERVVLTHNYLFNAAYHSHIRAVEEKKASFYFFMTSLVFSAFSLEAYLNHVGDLALSYWEELERKIPLESKLKIIYSIAGLDFDPSKRPIQTVKKLVKFRNAMAHGRTEKLSKSGEMQTSELPMGQDLVATEWEDYCTEENVKRGLDDVREVMEEIHQAMNLEGVALGSLGSGSHTISKKKK